MQQNQSLIHITTQTLPQTMPESFDEIIKNKAVFFAIDWTKVFKEQAGIYCPTPHAYRYFSNGIFDAKAYCAKYYPREDYLDQLAWLQKYLVDDVTKNLNIASCVEALSTYPRSLDYEPFIISMFLAKDTQEHRETMRAAVQTRLANAADHFDIAEVINIMLHFGPMIPEVLSFTFSPLFTKQFFDVVPLAGDKAYKIAEVTKSTDISDEIKQGLITFLEAYKGNMSDNLFYIKQIVTNTYRPLLKEGLFALQEDTSHDIVKTLQAPNSAG